MFSIILKVHSYTFTILKMDLPSTADLFRALTLY